MSYLGHAPRTILCVCMRFRVACKSKWGSVFVFVVTLALDTIYYRYYVRGALFLSASETWKAKLVERKYFQSRNFHARSNAISDMPRDSCRCVDQCVCVCGAFVFGLVLFPAPYRAFQIYIFFFYFLNTRFFFYKQFLLIGYCHERYSCRVFSIIVHGW